MKNFTVVTLSMAITLALPLAAQAAQTRLTAEQLKKDANVVAFCKKDNKYVKTAEYLNDTENKVKVTCTEDAEGFLPLVALGGLGTATSVAVAGVVLAAVASGDNNTTPDTQ